MERNSNFSRTRRRYKNIGRSCSSRVRNPKKVNLTGSVAMAESDVLEDRPIANLAQGLQGVIPNLNISFANGNPNAETSINVRGLTSLNGGSALVLVDGVETNDISLINPQDIESISVLRMLLQQLYMVPEQHLELC